jgi:3-hydroxybutyryl-CoA dehydratase
MLTASLISAVIGTKLPGPGSIYLAQTLEFRTPAYLGDTLTAACTVLSYEKKRGRMTLRTVVKNQRDEEVVTGEATVHYRP